LSISKGLIIFIKNPVLGKVKTRLANTIGDERALKIYRHLLNHTRKVSEKVDAFRFLFYSDTIIPDDEWSNDLFQKHQQDGIGLGSKIQNAFNVAFLQSQYNVIIGSDCLDIGPEIITESYKHLEAYDLVIGPAMDGGYYLIGMKSYYASLFEDIEWSSEKVLSQTIEKAKSLKLNVKLMTELSDIDNEDDLAKYRL
jgi:rSAM/selenodomain-associated transferase 1